MKKQRLGAAACIVLFVWLCLPRPSWPQLILGQYEDEAPLRTWNHYGFLSASSIAVGGTRYAFPLDCSSSLSNPALLTLLPKFSVSVNTSYGSASLFKYSLVNTGAVTSDGNLSLHIYALDFGGASVVWKNWAVSFGQALTEVYERPSIEERVTYRGSLYYTFDFNQGGQLLTTHFAVGRRISPRLSVGLGFNYVHGEYNKYVRDEWTLDNITITDDKSSDLSGYYLNGGVWFGLTDKVSLAAVFRTPYTRKADSSSSYRYLSPQGSTDISIDAAARNEYKQPLVLGLGLNYQFRPNLRLASDLSFFNWSDYKVTYFGEELERAFKNIIQVGAGFEYLSEFVLFGQTIQSPLRVGVMYDPQPMEEPSSSYFYLTVGTGVHCGKFSLDAGVFLGRESGSGDELRARKLSLSLSYGL